MSHSPTSARPSRTLTLRNQQRDRTMDTRDLRRRVRAMLEDQLGLKHYDLAVHLVSEQAIANANETHLQHPGPTDVISFDYAEVGSDDLHGELLVCPAVAVRQARDYQTPWKSEVLRYIIHGILHLRGFDDRTAAGLRVMRREEDRLLKALARAPSPPRQYPRGRPPRKRPLE